MRLNIVIVSWTIFQFLRHRRPEKLKTIVAPCSSPSLHFGKNVKLKTRKKYFFSKIKKAQKRMLTFLLPQSLSSGDKKINPKNTTAICT